MLLSVFIMKTTEETELLMCSLFIWSFPYRCLWIMKTDGMLSARAAAPTSSFQDCSCMLWKTFWLSAAIKYLFSFYIDLCCLDTQYLHFDIQHLLSSQKQLQLSKLWKCALSNYSWFNLMAKKIQDNIKQWEEIKKWSRLSFCRVQDKLGGWAG